MSQEIILPVNTIDVLFGLSSGIKFNCPCPPEFEIPLGPDTYNIVTMSERFWSAYSGKDCGERHITFMSALSRAGDKYKKNKDSRM